MDTISKGKFENTNLIFERPNKSEKTNYHIKDFNSDFYAQNIVSELITFDWRKPTVQMLGRWQPFHDGHLELFKRAFNKTSQVVIQVRDCQDWNDSNPFNFEDINAAATAKSAAGSDVFIPLAILR